MCCTQDGSPKALRWPHNLLIHSLLVQGHGWQYLGHTQQGPDGQLAFLHRSMNKFPGTLADMPHIPHIAYITTPVGPTAYLNFKSREDVRMLDEEAANTHLSCSHLDRATMDLIHKHDAFW